MRHFTSCWQQQELRKFSTIFNIGKRQNFIFDLANPRSKYLQNRFAMDMLPAGKHWTSKELLLHITCLIPKNRENERRFEKYHY